MTKLKKILSLQLLSTIWSEPNVFEKIKPDASWQRKKCKSCYNFTMAYQQCSKNPNNKACELYCKRKK